MKNYQKKIWLIFFIIAIASGWDLRQLAYKKSGGSYKSSSSSYKSSSSRSSYTKPSGGGYTSSGSSYKSSGSSYKSSGSSYKKYTPTYQTTANPVSYTNSYFSGGKTYKPLTTYYKPPNYYNANGYYSTTYLKVYYDGYGYNFYYGDVGYYEYSVNQTPSGGGGLAFLIVCLVLGSWFLYLYRLMMKDQSRLKTPICILASVVCYIPWFCNCLPCKLFVKCCDRGSHGHNGGRQSPRRPSNKNSPYTSLFRSGAMWNWHHGGADAPANGQIECTDNHKVRWSGGQEQGYWKFLAEDIVRIEFNGISHMLIKSKENEDWNLINPKRDPRSVMRSCESPIYPATVAPIQPPTVEQTVAPIQPPTVEQTVAPIQPPTVASTVAPTVIPMQPSMQLPMQQHMQNFQQTTTTTTTTTSTHHQQQMYYMMNGGIMMPPQMQMQQQMPPQ